MHGEKRGKGTTGRMNFKAKPTGGAGNATLRKPRSL